MWVVCALIFGCRTCCPWVSVVAVGFVWTRAAGRPVIIGVYVGGAIAFVVFLLAGSGLVFWLTARGGYQVVVYDIESKRALEAAKAIGAKAAATLAELGKQADADGLVADGDGAGELLGVVGGVDHLDLEPDQGVAAGH